MTTPSRGHVIPTLRYRDARAAIEGLCSVFGFTRHAVYEDGGVVAHAELALGDGFIMVGSARTDAADTYGDNLVQPDEIGGKETQAAYLVVPDADAVYARAMAAGFPIVIEIKDESHGGRAFSCRDREGRFWNVGTYDPRVPAGSA
ncbi:MAG: VOC family protein [Bauldia sp.]